jgi:hypothetical protein
MPEGVTDHLVAHVGENVTNEPAERFLEERLASKKRASIFKYIPFVFAK